MSDRRRRQAVLATESDGQQEPEVCSACGHDAHGPNTLCLHTIGSAIGDCACSYTSPRRMRQLVEAAASSQLLPDSIARFDLTIDGNSLLGLFQQVAAGVDPHDLVIEIIETAAES